MKKKVLFLCTGNSCRSQMTEGLLRHYYSDKYEAFSAGTKPTAVNSNAIKVMSEIGIDISGQKSKSVEELRNQHFDIVITVCDNAKESCPDFAYNTEKLHWSFIDPAEATGSEEEILNVFRDIRNQIKKQIADYFN